MAYTPRGFPTPVISPAGAGTVSVVKTSEELYSDGWYNAWTVTATAKPGYRFVRFYYAEWEDYPKPGHEITDSAGSPWVVEQQGIDWGGSVGYEEWYVTRVTAVFEAVTPPATGLILRSASTGVILRSASSGIILRDS